MRRDRRDLPHDQLGRRCGPTGKRRYKSEEQAMEHARRILGRTDCNSDGFRGYKCQFCGGWHLTSQV